MLVGVMPVFEITAHFRVILLHVVYGFSEFRQLLLKAVYWDRITGGWHAR
ncbi:MAG: hypothetical protein ACPL4E_07290 [Thermoproteota archaeon]